MWAMLVIIMASSSATSSVIYFPTQERCQNAQSDLTIGLRALPAGTQFTITCIPVAEGK
jgi:hypothetical protein